MAKPLTINLSSWKDKTPINLIVNTPNGPKTIWKNKVSRKPQEPTSTRHFIVGQYNLEIMENRNQGRIEIVVKPSGQNNTGECPTQMSNDNMMVKLDEKVTGLKNHFTKVYDRLTWLTEQHRQEWENFQHEIKQMKEHIKTKSPIKEDRLLDMTPTVSHHLPSTSKKEYKIHDTQVRYNLPNASSSGSSSEYTRKSRNRKAARVRLATDWCNDTRTDEKKKNATPLFAAIDKNTNLALQICDCNNYLKNFCDKYQEKMEYLNQEQEDMLGGVLKCLEEKSKIIATTLRGGVERSTSPQAFNVEKSLTRANESMVAAVQILEKELQAKEIENEAYKRMLDRLDDEKNKAGTSSDFHNGSKGNQYEETDDRLETVRQRKSLSKEQPSSLKNAPITPRALPALIPEMEAFAKRCHQGISHIDQMNRRFTDIEALLKKADKLQEAIQNE